MASPGCEVHALPARLARRGSDATRSSTARSSICWDEAENRKHSIRGLLAYFCPETVLDEDKSSDARDRVNDVLEKIGKTPVA